jgi:hypothetical protein
VRASGTVASGPDVVGGLGAGGAFSLSLTTGMGREVITCVTCLENRRSMRCEKMKQRKSADVSSQSERRWLEAWGRKGTVKAHPS